MVFDIFNRMYQFSVLKNYTRQVFNGFVIPAPIFIGINSSRNPGFPVKTGIQFHMFLVPCFRRDKLWIPAFAGMTKGDYTFNSFSPVFSIMSS